MLQHLSNKGKDPLFLQWDCVNRKCRNCGVAKLGGGACDIWRMCNQKIEVSEWAEVLWQGRTNGKQNTQLELGHQ
eukprot:2429533-Ditylum_brightwellii.AAC.1